MKFNESIYDSHALYQTPVRDYHEFEQVALDFLSAGGVDGATVMLTKDTDTLECRMQSLLLQILHPGNFRVYDVFPRAESLKKFSPDTLLNMLQIGRKAGFGGVYFNRSDVAIRLDDPRLAPLFAWMAESSYPLLLDATLPGGNVPRRGPGAQKILNQSASAEQKACLLCEVEQVLLSYPALRLTLASSFYFYDNVDLLADFLTRHPMVSIDVSPCSEQYYAFSQQRARWQAFFEQFNRQILFGSKANIEDAGYSETIANIRHFFETDEPYFTFPLLGGWGFDVQGIALTNHDLLDGIYRGNYLRVNPVVSNSSAGLALEYYDEMTQLLHQGEGQSIESQSRNRIAELHKRYARQEEEGRR